MCPHVSVSWPARPPEADSMSVTRRVVVVAPSPTAVLALCRPTRTSALVQAFCKVGRAMSCGIIPRLALPVCCGQFTRPSGVLACCLPCGCQQHLMKARLVTQPARSLQLTSSMQRSLWAWAAVGAAAIPLWHNPCCHHARRGEQGHQTSCSIQGQQRLAMQLQPLLPPTLHEDQTLSFCPVRLHKPFQECPASCLSMSGRWVIAALNFTVLMRDFLIQWH